VILDEPPRGGLIEAVGGERRPLRLTNAEIERFEDLHRGIFDLWDGIMGRGVKPTFAEVRDLIALALVGGGLPEIEAKAVIEGLEPSDALQMRQIAQAALGVAFLPDSVDGGGDEVADEPGDAAEKKT
jgi:hypothetical protein